VPPLEVQAEIIGRVQAVDRHIAAELLKARKLRALRDDLRDDLLSGRVRVAVAAEAAA
jgi:hypothetical protein